MIKIYAMSIKEASFDDSLLHLITDKRKSLIDETENRERKIQHLYTDFLVRYVLKREFNVSWEELYYEAKGKPIYHKNYHISLSHSGQFIVVGVSDTTSFGVDIQKMDSKYLSLSKRIMDQTSLEIFEKSSHQMNFFFKQWTAKEAFLKMLGTGIVSDLKKVTIVEKKISNGNQEGIVMYHQIDGHMISIVSETNDAYVYRELNINDIKKEI